MRARVGLAAILLVGIALTARVSGAQNATVPPVGALGPSASVTPAHAVSVPENDKADTPDNADPSKDPLMSVSISQSMQNISRLRQPDVKPQELNTLFFTLWQYQLLQDAKRLYRTHPVDPNTIPTSGDANGKVRPRSIRELSVGGILYRGQDDWTVYLNGQRITQDKNSLPEQVMDIKVSDDYIDLKWFDTFTNLIFPVRLREHQRFNLDARMFITGQGTETAGTQ
jgi:hypothetical protein